LRILDKDSELAALTKSNAELNDQLKLLARLEKRLFHTQNSLELQLRRIRALNDFALTAMPTTSPSAILTQAIELLCPLYAVQAAVAVLYPGPGAQPLALSWTVDGEVTATEPPASLIAMPSIDATNRAYLVARGACEPPLRPLVTWLDEVMRSIGADYDGWAQREVVLSVGADSGATRALLAFYSAALSSVLTVPGEADLPFLEVVCRHVSRTMEMAALHATLEQRVQDRTLALRDSNEQLAESLERLTSAQRQLVEVSRKAGMSEIATSVLHNVGNVLNSVNVSANLVEERVSQLRARNIGKLAELVRQHRDDLPRFFAEDPRAASFSSYLDALGRAVDADQQHLVGELSSLRRNVDHIKAIIMLQQDFAKTPNGVAERLSLIELIEDALCFDRPAYERHGILVERRFEPLAPVVADRHKILQILTNLLSNARHAVAAQPPELRRVAIRACKVEDNHVIEVIDTGCGVASENLGRVFNLGFTTRADGHGFGLHSSACAATELGGTLTCHSDGRDRGARFRLCLPLAAADS
jgi:signal transduction histidine kinase